MATYLVPRVERQPPMYSGASCSTSGGWYSGAIQEEGKGKLNLVHPRF